MLTAQCQDERDLNDGASYRPWRYAPFVVLGCSRK